MKKKNKNNNIQDIIQKYIPLLAIFLMILSFVFLVKPKISQILELKEKIKKDKQTLKTLTEKTFFLESLNEADLLSKSEKTLKVLPEEINFPLVLGTIREIGKNLGVNITKININLSSSLDKKEELKSIIFDLGVEGDKEGIKNFLKEIEECAPLMNIKLITTELEGKNWEGGLKIETYYLSLPKTLGKIETPVPLLTQEEEKIYQNLDNFNQKFFLGENTFETITQGVGKEDPFSF